MNKYYQSIQNASGDAKTLARVQVFDSGGSIVTIYADDGGTRFTDSTGANVNYCTADSDGMVEFYWTAASSQTLQILDSAGNLEKSIADFANNFSVPETTADVGTILGAAVADGDLGTFTGTTIADDSTAKAALQALETAVETKATAATLAATGGAALVGTADGGTVEQAISDITPERYGASGNILFDDATPLQTAMTTAATLGRRLVLSKVYYTSAALVAASGLMMVGSGAAAGIVQTSNQTKCITGDNVQNITLKDFAITGKGDGSDISGNNSSLIVFNATGGELRNIVINGLTLSGFKRFGVSFTGTGPTYSCVVQNCIITGTETAASQYEIAVTFQGSTGGFGNVLRDNEISGTSQGVTTNALQQGLAITGNHIHDITGQHGIYCQSGKGTIISHNRIYRCTQNGIKVQIQNGDTTTHTGLLIEGNIVHDTYEHCIRVHSSHVGNFLFDIAIGVNTVKGLAAFDSATSGGISLENCKEGTVAPCNISNVGKNGLELNDCYSLQVGIGFIRRCGWSGLYIDTTCDEIHASGGRIDSAGQLTTPYTSSQSGARITAAGRVSLRNVRFSNATGVGTMPNLVYHSNATGCPLFSMSGLRGSGCSSHAIRLASATVEEYDDCYLRGSGLTTANRNSTRPTSGMGSGGAIFFGAKPADFTTGDICRLRYSGTWNPTSIASGGSQSTTFTVTGAVPGDYVEASGSYTVALEPIIARVTAADTVTCTLKNNSGGALDAPQFNIFINVECRA